MIVRKVMRIEVGQLIVLIRIVTRIVRMLP